MLTLYAKNLSGDCLPLSVPASSAWKTFGRMLVARLCPEEPSRLSLLPPLERGEGESEEKEHSYAVCVRTERDEENVTRAVLHLPAWGENHVWADGDIVSYLLQPLPAIYVSPHCTQWVPHFYIPSYSQDPVNVYAYYTLTLCYQHNLRPVYQYVFLYHVATKRFVRRPDVAYNDHMRARGNWLTLADHATFWTNFSEMVQSDPALSEEYREALVGYEGELRLPCA